MYDSEATIKIVRPEGEYELITKSILSDKRIDTVTLGVFVRIITTTLEHPSIKAVAELCGLAEYRVRLSLKSLEEAGYLARVRTFDNQGRITGFEYTLTNEKPCVNSHHHGENSIMENTPSWRKLHYGTATENQQVTSAKSGGTSDCADNNIYNRNIVNSNDTDTSVTKDKGVRGKRKKTDLLPLPYGDAFREAWATLLTQPKWKRKTIEAYNLALGRLAALGSEAEAVRAIEDAILGDWKGIYPKEATTKISKTNDNRNNHSTADRLNPEVGEYGPGTF